MFTALDWLGWLVASVAAHHNVKRTKRVGGKNASRTTVCSVFVKMLPFRQNVVFPSKCPVPCIDLGLAEGSRKWVKIRFHVFSACQIRPRTWIAAAKTRLLSIKTPACSQAVQACLCGLDSSLPGSQPTSRVLELEISPKILQISSLRKNYLLNDVKSFETFDDA